MDKLVVDRIGVMMYKYANDLLPPALNYLYTSNSDVHNYTTRQRHLLQSKIEVNISLSKFKISLKLCLQENSLQLKYTK